MAEELRSLYLIAGTDGAKIDASRARLKARAESEGGSGSLEVFEAVEGRGAPDHEALLGCLPAMSLTGERRYLLVDGVERWRDRQLVARGEAPETLERAVRAAAGEVHSFAAPSPRSMPRTLVAEAGRLGYRLEPSAAVALVERMGANPVRLHQELERLAIWAGDGGEV